MFKETCSIENELRTVINIIFWASRPILDNEQTKTINIRKIKCRSETNLKT